MVFILDRIYDRSRCQRAFSRSLGENGQKEQKEKSEDTVERMF